MAKRSRRAGPEIDPSETPAATGEAEERVVVFRIADASLAFRLDAVSEIVRPPALALMPLAPPSLLGLANLRGTVLPVVGLRRLLERPDASLDEGARVIVIDGGAPVGFAVDRVERLMAVPADQVERTGAGTVDPALVHGVIKGAEGDHSIEILDPQRLLREKFSRLGTAEARSARVAIAGTAAPVAQDQRRQESLVTFALGRQDYAIALDRVREVIALPEHVSEVPRAETAVLGVVTLRDRLLPLVSLRALLGLPVDREREQRGKVVVLSMGRNAVGVVADRTREILRIDPELIEPAPALLTRGGGEAEITSICRLDNGRRLVAVLSPDRLFRSDLVRRVLAEHDGDGPDAKADEQVMAADEQLIIFRLGDQEFGLPIGAVDEIARPPERVTRLPKAPAFVDGVMNLRGGVVPIVDLRRRFGLAARDATKEPGTAQRILVLAIGGGKTGFMVDGVSEVLRVPVDAISPAPELSPEQARLIGRVANLAAQGRMILLVDPAQLLDQVEADMLAAFDRTEGAKASRAS